MDTLKEYTLARRRELMAKREKLYAELEPINLELKHLGETAKILKVSEEELSGPVAVPRDKVVETTNEAIIRLLTDRPNMTAPEVHEALVLALRKAYRLSTIKAYLVKLHNANTLSTDGKTWTVAAKVA